MEAPSRKENRTGFVVPCSVGHVKPQVHDNMFLPTKASNRLSMEMLSSNRQIMPNEALAMVVLNTTVAH